MKALHRWAFVIWDGHPPTFSFRTPWLAAVICWEGLSGSLARYRWGISRNYLTLRTSRFPTIYAGPLKVITGP